MTDEQQPQPGQRQRSTQEELEERYEKAADLLAEGHPGRSIVQQLTQEFKVTPQQARKYVREGRLLLTESVGVDNRAGMFSQVFSGLQTDRLEAHRDGNITAAVAASKTMVQMLGQLGQLDPMRDFEQQFMRAASPFMNNNKGTIPRASVDLSALDEEMQNLMAELPEEPPF
jgi:hypothetical protein